MQKGIKRLGDAELEIMLVVWQAGEGGKSASARTAARTS